MQLNTVSHASNTGAPSALQTVAAMAVGATFPTTTTKKENPYANQSIWQEVTSLSELYKYDDAYQLVMAALSNPSTTPNAFLNSAQMDDMQTAYTRGTKVFIVRDSARCYIVPVAALSSTEQSLVAQTYAGCFSH